MPKFVEVVPSYPHKFPLRYKEDYFYWPAKLMMGKGFDVEFLTTEKGKDNEMHNGLVVRRFSSPFSIRSYIEKDRDIKLVHAHLRPYPPSLISGFSKKPSILTPHTYALSSNPLVSAFSVFAMNRFDRVVVLTPHEMEIYRKAGVSMEKMVLLPHPVDYKFYSSKPSTSAVKRVRKAYGIKDEFVIVTVANFRKCKRIDAILKAFRVFSERFSSRLIIVGDDLLWTEKAPSISSMIEGMGLKNVVCTGFLAPEKVREIFSVSDVFVSSSEIEAQGLSVYESAASGLPLCISRIGSLTSVFADKAVYHEPGDFMKLASNLSYYAENRAEAVKAGLRLSKFVRAWDFNKLRKRMESLYDEVINKDK